MCITKIELMNKEERINHWNTIYQNKKVDEVSWYQPVPHTSLEYVKEFNLSKTARIIDVGGGDSFFVDHLLDLGFENVTVLDISSEAIKRAQERLGQRADLVTWIVSDVTVFHPEKEYDFWHDRAVFHFLNEDSDIEKYIDAVSITDSGKLVVGTFSESGPEKCSGIAIKQYTVDSMTARFGLRFKQIGHQIIDHKTPSGKVQNFVFCVFEK